MGKVQVNMQWDHKGGGKDVPDALHTSHRCAIAIHSLGPVESPQLMMDSFGWTVQPCFLVTRECAPKAGPGYRLLWPMTFSGRVYY